jgi:hypothetical protein
LFEVFEVEVVVEIRVVLQGAVEFALWGAGGVGGYGVLFCGQVDLLYGL